MPAFEFFESIPRLQRRVDALEAAIESAYAAAGPHGQQLGTIGGGHGHDALAGIDSIVDSNATLELDRARYDLETRLDLASDVLYGRSGRGGVARMLDWDGAEMLHRHYLCGESWAGICRDICPDDESVANMTLWCERKAEKLCRQIDRLGMGYLADS